MTRRLLISYLGLAVVILLVLEVPLATLAQRFERGLATSQAQRDASGLVAIAADDVSPDHRTQLQAAVLGYGAKTGGEVTVVSLSGEVLATSSSDADSDVRQEWRLLLERALQGQTVSAFVQDEGGPYAVAAAPVVEDGTLTAAVLLGAPAQLTQNRIHQIWLALGLFAVAAMVIAGAAGVVMSRSLALPLGRLEQTVGRFGRGDLASRANEVQGPAEVRSLARQFNQMAAQLDELIQAQKQFVADASHQLRSPLTALRLRLENLEAIAGEADVESIAAVGREVQRLSRIVDGLLTLGRTPDEVAEPVEVLVADVIRDRCEAWSALGAEKGVALESVNHWEDLRLTLQPGELEQILDNLLANAVEVSPSPSSIRVDLRRAGAGGAEIHVIDEGPGLDEEGRRRAFDRFWQGSSNPTGHSGLGLAIVRQLASRNGLDVALRPVAGHGLDAVVVLPRPAPR